ncbi:hypothetical protein RJ639_017292 [Escallonia herrerae]|uniref:Integrase catalytic domain-containing protein n=1 Tax=Escallonia herrerae TaxID=1293975 RepID=A0AA88VDT9_9ASTE|nr:hypothetical protein RJ639_017292 [Escallonia herrerae]
MSYGGAHDAKELKNFLFYVEQYFRAIKVDSEGTKVSMATIYLVGDAKLWWRKKYAEIEDESCIINTWEILKCELKSQFFPENTAFNARKALLECKHTGSVREYCQAFSALMLDISDMSTVDRLFFFMEGLKPWARTELNRREVNNLNEAIIATKSLSDYNFEPQRSPQRVNPSRRNDVKKPGVKCQTKVGAVGNPERDVSGEKPKDTLPRKKGDIPGKGLIYMDIKVNGKAIRAMVDTCATHNYISSTEVESLGLTLEKGWNGTNFSVVTMDNFKLNLGLEFLCDTKTTVMPCTNSLVMLGNKPCVIPTISPRAREYSISALQLKKGLKWDETTYLAMLQWDEIEELSGPLLGQLAMSEDPVLAFSDVSKSFKVHTDDFDFAQGGVLIEPLFKSIQAHLQTGQMAEFNFILEYKAGSTNSVADALNRRTELDHLALVAMNAIVRSDSRVSINIGKKIKKALTKDPTVLARRRPCQRGDDIGSRSIGLLLAPNAGIFEDMLHLVNMTRWSVKRKQGYFNRCQFPKSVSLDFITSFPKVEDLGTILVVDRFSKYASFIAAPKYCSAEETAYILQICGEVLGWGMPQDIVSDWDSRFTWNFWIELFKLFGSQLSMSSSYHPELDGQMERFNSMLE